MNLFRWMHQRHVDSLTREWWDLQVEIGQATRDRKDESFTLVLIARASLVEQKRDQYAEKHGIKIAPGRGVVQIKRGLPA